MTPFIQLVRFFFGCGAVAGLVLCAWNLLSGSTNEMVVGAIIFAAGALGFGIATLLLRVHSALRP